MTVVLYDVKQIPMCCLTKRHFRWSDKQVVIVIVLKRVSLRINNFSTIGLWAIQIEFSIAQLRFK